MPRIVEKHFDAFFSKKEWIDYQFDIRKMSVKDRNIAKALMRYNVRGKKCLDVGPGTGRWLTFLKQQEASYLGAIDISRKSLERCKALCSKSQRADLENDDFEFDSDFFDVVISFEVLEHLRDPYAYLSEIRRVIKNDGLILMSLPNIVSFISRLRMIFGIMPVAIATDNTHVKFYRRKDLVTLFRRFDLTIEFIPTSISLNPREPKSRFSFPSIDLISNLDDSLLFSAYPTKALVSKKLLP